MTTAGEQQAAGAELRRFLTLRRALFGDGNKPVAAVKPDTAVSGDEAALLGTSHSEVSPCFSFCTSFSLSSLSCVQRCGRIQKTHPSFGSHPK